MKLLTVVISLFVILSVAMGLHPYNRFDWMLENLLIWCTLFVMVVTFRFFTLSTVSYIMIFLFLSLHTIGAHYSYTTNALDELLIHLFGLERDPYDRVVHFSYGLLLANPIRELVIRMMGISHKWSYICSPMIVLASGAFYELIEMWVAFIVAPEMGTLFLGTQGDPWDTQHDMALAMYGSVITMGVTWIYFRWVKGKEST